MKYFIIYLLLINAFGLLLMLVDKKRAIHNQWRIKENTLIFVAVIFGSVGVIIGMRAFRHKTKHPKFSIGVPLILVLQILAAILIPLKFLT